ncbi:hypothetical protein BRADI_3g44373v3 [Brachypodium distachyon]|uniref:Uncharacterized protein n=1 Tax=Brachypodium distachyon TaxID=15368 RepID=A0A2K2D344_BRADI|nr:hypothetical protein BRADI_3g44373v3 [Brachypodium distachyon]
MLGKFVAWRLWSHCPLARHTESCWGRPCVGRVLADTNADGGCEL